MIIRTIQASFLPLIFGAIEACTYLFAAGHIMESTYGFALILAALVLILVWYRTLRNTPARLLETQPIRRRFGAMLNGVKVHAIESDKISPNLVESLH